MAEFCAPKPSPNIRVFHTFPLFLIKGGWLEVVTCVCLGGCPGYREISSVVGGESSGVLDVADLGRFSV